MTRPWLIVSVLGAALLAALAAVGWISAEILRLDRNEREARARAALEENVRLSLWRMDSFLSPLIAQESARPYFQYTPFYPAERAYTKMFAEIQANDVIIPSPLLTFESPYIRLHFQVEPEHKMTSPQVPVGNMRDLAEVGNYRTGERVRGSGEWLARLQRELTEQDLSQALPLLVPRQPSAQDVPVNGDSGNSSSRPGSGSQSLPDQQAPNAGSFRLSNVLDSYRNDSNVAFGSRLSPDGQSTLNRQEQSSRNVAFQNANTYNPDVLLQTIIARPIDESLLTPVWLSGNLFLARRILANDQSYIQGCWLDWEKIRSQLLESIRDLLPRAELIPEPQASGVDETRRLAALPVFLLPNEAPLSGDDTLSPVGRSLVLAWVAALLASLLAAIVLWQALSLSERRGAFVSAVTHELRTPLTTFRLYTDLLTQHPDAPAAKRNGYLITMRREAERLSHLVENVLAYARLERKSVAARMEERGLGELVEGLRERLRERAAQAGLELTVLAPPEAAKLRIRVDPGAFEQIVFNLVDNASKYAASASEPVVQVELAHEGSKAVVRVRDRGPGIAVEEARKLFRPFSKSARQAAVSAPGVGLGLALSRRLARQLGGELTLDPPVAQQGACFKLELPCQD